MVTATDNGRVKNTNIKVCVRIRPLLVNHSQQTTLANGILSGRSTHVSDNRMSNRSSLLRSPNTHTTTKTTFESPGSPPVQVDQSNETIIAWDIVSTDTIQQSARTERIQGRTISYTLDQVYGSLATTAELYQQSVQPVVRSALEGYHGSVFAYGQTSTGKTYTMTGTPTSPGIVSLAVDDIFQYVQQGDQAAREYLIRFSYIEIYNEQIVDLLSEASSSIRILEGKDGVSVRGLREQVVTAPADIFDLLRKGERRRQVGSTNMNRHSSRSHAIVRIWIESKVAGLNSKTRASSLSLVDLAGSESVRLTGSTGDRKREGQYINKSLMALGQVIYKLSENEKSHIPYRDSKLTRLLQPSLSGNAQIVSICNISPSVSHIEESHNTLKFAMRAKRVQQRAVLNEVLDESTLLQEYKDEIEDLKQQLAEAKAAQQEQQNDEDSRELIQAIQKMEALILKTHALQENLSVDENLAPGSHESGELLRSPELTQNNDQTQPEKVSKQATDRPLLDEMQRIQGLLGSVLHKQGRSLSQSKSVNDLTSMVHREEEVDVLRSQLLELEVATCLKRADADFLQSQLQQKDMLLAEVAQILDIVEKRQVELESDNDALKRMVIDKSRKLALKDKCIADRDRKILDLERQLNAAP
jgi:centromeric protein E